METWFTDMTKPHCCRMIIGDYDVNLIWALLVLMTVILTIGGSLVTTVLERFTPQWFIDSFRSVA